jgi:hypothetical protein
MTAAADLPLPTFPADPELTVTCHCGAPRSGHAGRKHLGHCQGHDVTYDEPAGVVAATIVEPCPDGCRRFWPARGERLRLRAVAAFDEPLMVAIEEADKARPRTRKTDDARAEGLFGVGPSDIGRCRKQIEYRENPPEGYEPISVDRAAAYEGTLLHEGIERARRRRYPWRKFSVPIHVPGLDRPGEIDEYDPILGTVIDVKTKGTYAWELLGKDGPADSEWDQVFLYGMGLEHAGQPIEWVELHCYNRENFRHPERFRRPYSRARALTAVQRLHSILDDLTAGRELPRDEPGPSLSAICRNFCPSVRDCWNVTEAELNRRTPEGWMVARDDEGVEAALGRYLDAHATLFKPGQDAKEREKVIVEGAPYGRYGHYTYSLSGGNSSWKDDLVARAGQLEAEMRQAVAEGRPPADPELLPVPQRQVTTPTTNRIARVRKATLEAEAKAAATAVEAGE